MRRSFQKNVTETLLRTAPAVLGLLLLVSCRVLSPRTPWDNAEPYLSEHFAAVPEPGLRADEFAPVLEKMGQEKEYLQNQFFPNLPAGRINVLLFRDMKSYNKYRLLPLESLADYERARRRIGITFNAAPYVWRHELAHALLEASRPDLPYWLQEGLALFLQTFNGREPVRCSEPAALGALTRELLPYLEDVRKLPMIDPTTPVDLQGSAPSRIVVQMTVPPLFILYIWQEKKLLEYLRWLQLEKDADPLFFFTHGNKREWNRLMENFRAWLGTDAPARRLAGC